MLRFGERKKNPPTWATLKKVQEKKMVVEEKEKVQQEQAKGLKEQERRLKEQAQLLKEQKWRLKEQEQAQLLKEQQLERRERERARRLEEQERRLAEKEGEFTQRQLRVHAAMRQWRDELDKQSQQAGRRSQQPRAGTARSRARSCPVPMIDEEVAA